MKRKAGIGSVFQAKFIRWKSHAAAEGRRCLNSRFRGASEAPGSAVESGEQGGKATNRRQRLTKKCGVQSTRLR